MPKIGELWAEIGARTDKLDRAINDSTRKFEQFSQKMGRVGTTLTFGVSVPLLAIGRNAVKAASDAEETRSKFQAVFKSLSSGVQQWAKINASSVGRSSEDWLKYLAAVQDTLVPLGFAREEAADMSKQVVTLAEDLASFNNLRTDDVVQRLTSALVGNVENLRQFGVVANEAQIKNKALRDGIIRSTKDAITPQQKALTILRLTMEGTTDAQGDAARTAGSFANKTRGLEASFKDLSIAMGEKLLPTLAGVVDGLKGFVDQVNKLDTKNLEKLVVFLVTLAAAGPAIKLLSVISKLGPMGAAAAVGVGVWVAAWEVGKDVLDDIENKMLIVKRESIGLAGLTSLALSSHGGVKPATLNAAPGAGAVAAEGVSDATRLFIAGFRGVQNVTPLPQEKYPKRFTGQTAFEMRALGEMTEGMKKAANSMDRVAESASVGSVRMAQFGEDMRLLVADTLLDFTDAIGVAAANVVIFGDSLKDTLKNLAQNVGGSFLSSVVSFGASYALASIPGVGPLLDKLKGSAGGLPVGNYARPDFAGASQLSARVSLDTLVIEQQRTATRNNLNLLGLG